MSPFAARAWCLEAQAAHQDTVMFVGTQTVAPATSEGIYAYRWNAEEGRLTSLGLAARTVNPTFLAFRPDRKILIAANEIDNSINNLVDTAAGGHGDAATDIKTGSVSSFAVDGAGLKLVNTVSAHGAATCHVSVDNSGHAVIAANYFGGSAASFRLAADGRLSDAVSTFQYKGHGLDSDRQATAHAHRATVSPDNRFVLVNDLGLDRLHIYRLDAATARLTPAEPAEWKVTPGSGPRALRFHPNGRWAYCVNELTSTIDVLGWHAGQLSLVQTLRLTPEGFKGVARASEIVFDRAGQFAYAAVRDNNFVATMVVHEGTGKLTLMERGECGGKTPRHIALDPSERWLLVANQDSDVITAIARDPKTGRLASTQTSTALSKPQCLLFA